MSTYNVNTNLLQVDEDDEFGGAVVDINQLRTNALAIQTPEIVEDSNKPKGISKMPTLNETVGEILKLPDGWEEIATDAEFFCTN